MYLKGTYWYYLTLFQQLYLLHTSDYIKCWSVEVTLTLTVTTRSPLPMADRWMSNQVNRLTNWLSKEEMHVHQQAFDQHWMPYFKKSTYFDLLVSFLKTYDLSHHPDLADCWLSFKGRHTDTVVLAVKCMRLWDICLWNFCVHQNILEMDEMSFLGLTAVGNLI